MSGGHEFDDADLKRRFAVLRDEDEAAAPSFAATLAAARRRGDRGTRPNRSWNWGWALAVAGAAVVALVVLPMRLAGPGVATPDASLALTEDLQAWAAPTDELLASADLEAGFATGNNEDSQGAVFDFQSPTAGLLDLGADSPTRTP